MMMMMIGWQRNVWWLFWLWTCRQVYGLRAAWRHLLCRSYSGNSRQHSLGDNLAETSRRQQELISCLPSNPSRQRPSLPPHWYNLEYACNDPNLAQLLPSLLILDYYEPWTSARGWLLGWTSNRHFLSVKGTF